MSPLAQSDKDKFHQLYLSISKIEIPDFTDESAIQIGVEDKEGLEIINKANKRVAKTIK